MLYDLRGRDIMVLLVWVSVKKELFRVGLFGGVRVGAGRGQSPFLVMESLLV